MDSSVLIFQSMETSHIAEWKHVTGVKLGSTVHRLPVIQFNPPISVAVRLLTTGALNMHMLFNKLELKGIGFTHKE